MIELSGTNTVGSLTSVKEGTVTFFHLKTPKSPKVQCITPLAIDEDIHHLLSELSMHLFSHREQWSWRSSDNVYTGKMPKDRTSLSLLCQQFQKAALNSTLPSFTPAIHLTHLLNTH